MKSSAPASIARTFSASPLAVTMTTGRKDVVGVRADPAAGLVAVHPGHHDVEQHDVGQLLARAASSASSPDAADDHREAVRREHRVHEPEVLGQVVDDEDRGVVVVVMGYRRRRGRGRAPGRGSRAR